MRICFLENENGQESLIEPYLIIKRRTMHVISESGNRNMNEVQL